ncbi:unnamed protein product [Heterobilharzia americana]|nr:unnamed protein product [Heterobilharzia americana]
MLKEDYIDDKKLPAQHVVKDNCSEADISLSVCTPSDLKPLADSSNFDDKHKDQRTSPFRSMKYESISRAVCESPSKLVIKNCETESLHHLFPDDINTAAEVTDNFESEPSSVGSDLFPDSRTADLPLVNLVKLNQETNQKDLLPFEITSPQLENKVQHSTSDHLSTDTIFKSLSSAGDANDTLSTCELLQGEISYDLPSCEPVKHILDNKDLKNNDINLSDNFLLHKQIETLTCKLLATQDQVDRLLEEKRIWIGTTQHANGVKESNQVTPGELRGRWIQAKNLAETYKREKEAVVIKYAQSEQKRMQLEQQVHSLECKISRIINSNNLEQQHQRQAANENEHIDVNDKSSPKKQARKASTQRNDSHEKSNVGHLQKDLTSARERIDTLLKNNQLMIQESLKTEQKKSSSLNENLNRVNKALENALKQAKEAERLREREAERLCSEVALQEAQTNLKQLKIENDALKQKVMDLESVKCDFEKSQSRIDELTSELSSAGDMKLELQSCKGRVDQLSDFTRRLTERHANLQAEHLVTLNSLEDTRNLLVKKDEEIVQLKEKYESERNDLEVKMNTLQRKFNDLSVELNQLSDSENLLRIQLKEEKQRATTIHKRDAARIKDITREVTRLLYHYNKVNQLECCHRIASSQSTDLHDDLNSTSKSFTNSLNGSLKSLDLNQIPAEIEDDKVASPSSVAHRLVTGRCNSPSSSESNNSNHDDRNCEEALDETSVNLKCSELKLTDKLEFFQEHCYQLTEEINKKSRIIQSLLLSTNKWCESITSFISDNNQNKKTQTMNYKQNSIISSLTGSSIKTTKVTHSEIYHLENNKKLQNLLEDAIFKNISLKENLNTMGLEISSLRLNHERILNSLCQECKITNQTLHKTLTKSNQVHESSSHSVNMNSEPPVFQNGGVSA